MAQVGGDEDRRARYEEAIARQKALREKEKQDEAEQEAERARKFAEAKASLMPLSRDGLEPF
jgi:hypothetical protein